MSRNDPTVRPASKIATARAASAVAERALCNRTPILALARRVALAAHRKAAMIRRGVVARVALQRPVEPPARAGWAVLVADERGWLDTRRRA